jgi:hypothetical protein
MDDSPDDGGISESLAASEIQVRKSHRGIFLGETESPYSLGTSESEMPPNPVKVFLFRPTVRGYDTSDYEAEAEVQTSLRSSIVKPFYDGPNISGFVLNDAELRSYVSTEDPEKLRELLVPGLMRGTVESFFFRPSPERWFDHSALFILARTLISAKALRLLVLDRIRCVKAVPLVKLFEFFNELADGLLNLEELKVDITVGLRRMDDDLWKTSERIYSAAVSSGIGGCSSDDDEPLALSQSPIFQQKAVFRKLQRFTFGKPDASLRALEAGGRVDYYWYTEVLCTKLLCLLPSTLQELHLYSPTFRQCDALSLCTMLDCVPSLTALTCSISGFHADSAETLTASLRSLTKLTSFSLEYVCCASLSVDGVVIKRWQSVPSFSCMTALERLKLCVIGSFCAGNFWHELRDLFQAQTPRERSWQKPRPPEKKLRELHVQEIREFSFLTNLKGNGADAALDEITPGNMEKAMKSGGVDLEVLTWDVPGSLYTGTHSPPQHNSRIRDRPYFDYFPSMISTVRGDCLTTLNLHGQRLASDWGIRPSSAEGRVPYFHWLQFNSLTHLKFDHCQGNADVLLNSLITASWTKLKSFTIRNFEHAGGLLGDPNSGLQGKNCAEVSSRNPAERYLDLLRCLERMPNLVELEISGGVGFTEVGAACSELALSELFSKQNSEVRYCTSVP